jgi:hypothetical protein
MRLTKIDVAEAHIRAAVWMFFRGEHPVPVYTLANAAREIVGTIANQTDVETVQQELATARGVAPRLKLAMGFAFQWQARKRYLCWTSNPKKTGCAIDCGDCAPFSAMPRNRALKADCVN